MASTSSSSSSPSTASLITTLSPLSPLITYKPCISCSWTDGWKQGWNNSAAWDGKSQRWAEAWAVGSDIGVELEFEGTSLSFLTQPTLAYNLTLSVNSTEMRSISDLSTVSSVNITNLPFGTHSFSGVFRSRDSTRAPSQASKARLLGISIGWDNLTSTSATTTAVEPSVLDDSAWETNRIGLSPGWNLMSASNLYGNISNETQAGPIRSMIQSFHNQSVSWTSFKGSSLEFKFTGNYLNVMTAVQQSLAQFIPSIDGVAYPAVNLSKNMAPADADSSTTFEQIGWRKAGLASGDHTFQMTNVEEGGLMMVDYWEYGSAVQVTTPGTTTSSSSPSPTNTSSSVISNLSEASLTGIWVAVGIAILAGICLVLLIVFKAIQRRRRHRNPTLGTPSGGSAARSPNFFSSPATTVTGRVFGSSARQPAVSSSGPTRQTQTQAQTKTSSRPFSRLVNKSDVSVDSRSSTPTAPLWPRQDGPAASHSTRDQPGPSSSSDRTYAAKTTTTKKTATMLSSSTSSTSTSTAGGDRQDDDTLEMIGGQSPAMASVVTFTPQGTTRQVENAPVGLSAEIGDMSSLGVPVRDDGRGGNRRSGQSRPDTAYSQSVYSVDGSLRSESVFVERDQVDDKLGRLAQSHGGQRDRQDSRDSYLQSVDEFEDADEFSFDDDEDDGTGGGRRRRRTQESLPIGVSSMMMSPAGEKIEMKSGIHRRHPSVPSQNPEFKQTGNYF